MRSFDEIFEDKTKYGTKIKTSEYKEIGKYAIIDQGQEEIAGYTDLEKGVFEDVPAIIFGDHTRVIKYVRDPFFLGADGVKILKCKELNVNYKYLYYALKNAKIPNTGYNRHFKWLKQIQIEYPSIDKQEKIVKILDKVVMVIEDRRKEIQELDKLIKARFVEMFGDARKNPNKYDTVSFIDIVEYMGDIGSNGANKVVVDHLDMKNKEDYAMMVRFTNFTKNDFTDDVKYVSKEAYDFFKKSQIFGGELIICKIGSAGQNYVMPYLNRPVSLGLNQIMVRIKDNILMPYLYQYLHTDYGEFLISGCINGAVTKTITKTELKKIPVMLPPMELQREFVAFVEQVDKSKVVYQIIINKLTFLQKICYNNYKEQYHIPG